MVKRGATRRNKKVRGGAPKRVNFKISWSVGDSGKFLEYATSKGADLADLVDEIEAHVENAGYRYAQVPLVDERAEQPTTLNTVSATWEKSGTPPTLKELTIADPAATATFATPTDQFGKPLVGGKRGKTRRRR